MPDVYIPTYHHHVVFWFSFKVYLSSCQTKIYKNNSVVARPLMHFSLFVLSVVWEFYLHVNVKLITWLWGDAPQWCTILQRYLIIFSEWTGSRNPGFWNGPEFDDYSNHIFVTKTTLKADLFKNDFFRNVLKIRISLLYYFWKIGPEIFTWFSDPEFLGQKIDYFFYIPSFCTLGTWFVFLFMYK